MHRLTVGARTAKAVSSLSLVTLVVGSIWSFANARSITVTADELATAQSMVLSLHDSVHVLRKQVITETAQLDSAPAMIMPVAGPITSRFSRSRFHPILQIFRPHKGVDLSAPAGSQIMAPAPGRVSFVGWKLGDGLTIELSHNGGITTLYGHCKSSLVHVGDRVHVGQAIGTVGASGLATAPHVHFEVMVRGTPIDPLKYLEASHDSITAVAEKLRGQDQ
jgi:murein DD-endopeptidase MepM/ murein hydrolase activator NlpD